MFGYFSMKYLRNWWHMYQEFNKTQIKCFYLLACFYFKTRNKFWAKISQFFVNVGDADHQQPKNREHCQFRRKKFITFSTKLTLLRTESCNMNNLRRRTQVVRVWVFWIRSSSPFPAIWLGRDVRGECSKKTERMVKTNSERGVLLWYKTKEKGRRSWFL